jgi:predicted TIM-barrel fold metal-dependent hydrolase
MRIDVNTFVGAFPWRRVPGTSVAAVLAAMGRTRVDQAWISHLPGILWRDPMEGNDWLYEAAARESRLRPVAAVHPGLPGWEREVERARELGAAAVRCDPTWYAIAPGGGSMAALAQACGAASVPLQLAVRFEDGRQRHPLDRADELPPWCIRHLVRSDAAVRIVVTHADRPFIEEVHFGSTPDEASRIWWDLCWVWGPPEDHLETLLRTIGPERFVFGTGQPLRLPENAVAKLDLLDLPASAREAIESRNVLDRLVG